MPGTKTLTMLAAYNEMDVEPPLLFSSMFAVTKRSFFSTEHITFDITRGEESVAVPVPSLESNYRGNVAGVYTNKELTPPILAEDTPFSTFDLLDRTAGNTPYDDLRKNEKASVLEKILEMSQRLTNKMRRTIELQGSQIMQTGKLALPDDAGGIAYALDYFPKATHFPTVGTPWTAAGSTPVEDLSALGNVIRADGKHTPDTLIMGEQAYLAFIQNDQVTKLMNNRRIDLGGIRPGGISPSGVYKGRFELAHYSYDIWTYEGLYESPDTNQSTFFMDTNKVVMRASTGRLDSAFGHVPDISRLLGKIPLIPSLSRVASKKNRMDFFPKVTMNSNETVLRYGVKSRPLLIPTAIDTFGCLTAVY